MKSFLKTLILAKIFLKLQKNHNNEARIFLRKRIKIDYHTLVRIFQINKV